MGFNPTKQLQASEESWEQRDDLLEGRKHQLVVQWQAAWKETYKYNIQTEQLYLGIPRCVYIHIWMLKHLVKKEATNLKDSKNGCVERFRGRKGRGAIEGGKGEGEGRRRRGRGGGRRRRRRSSSSYKDGKSETRTVLSCVPTNLKENTKPWLKSKMQTVESQKRATINSKKTGKSRNY